MLTFFGLPQGLYGRLDKNYVFQTTVTNVEPTAKQSRVLNPYVSRHHITLTTLGHFLHIRFFWPPHSVIEWSPSAS